MRSILDKNIQKDIDADDGVYRYEMGFAGEIRGYIKQNYNVSKYDIDFKKLERQRQERVKAK